MFTVTQPDNTRRHITRPDNTEQFNVAEAGWQSVTYTDDEPTPSFVGFAELDNSILLRANVTAINTIDWSNVDGWVTDVPTDVSGLDEIRCVFDSTDNGTTVSGSFVGSVDSA